MAKNISIDCETCGETIRGKKGITWVDRDHLALRGSFTQQLVDEDGQPDHFYISEDPERMHHFCDWECLRGFADFREKRYEQIMADRRRRQAQEETNL